VRGRGDVLARTESTWVVALNAGRMAGRFGPHQFAMLCCAPSRPYVAEHWRRHIVGWLQRAVAIDSGD
jgi:hypothetical protein